MGTSDKTLIQYYSRDLHRNTVEIQDVSFTTGMPFAALLSAQPHTNPTPASLLNMIMLDLLPYCCPLALGEGSRALRRAVTPVLHQLAPGP